MFKKPLFDVEASGIAGQTAITAYNSMAGDNDGQGIMPYSTTNSLCRHRFFA